jgi:hypothetical protein
LLGILRVKKRLSVTMRIGSQPRFLSWAVPILALTVPIYKLFLINNISSEEGFRIS